MSDNKIFCEKKRDAQAEEETSGVSFHSARADFINAEAEKAFYQKIQAYRRAIRMRLE
jgi:hypothetical protein